MGMIHGVTVGRRRVFLVTQSGNTLRIVAYRFPQGGPPEHDESLNIPYPNRDHEWVRPTAPVFIGEKAYVGTGGGLVLFEPGKPLALLTDEDGLPGVAVSSLGAYEGTLYLGIGILRTGKWGFVSYDPDAGIFKTLASSASLGGASSGLKGKVIRVILPDPKRKCLWIGDEYIGLWRYDPETGRGRQILEWRFGLTCWEGIARPMSFSGDHLIYDMGTCGLVQVNLDEGSRTWLVGYRREFRPEGMDGEHPVFGFPALSLWPAWYDGSILITGGDRNRHVRLHRKGKAPAYHSEMKNVVFLEPIPAGVLAVSNGGGAWLIRKKN